MEAVSIDGSFGKGGGQIVRTSLSLAAILHKPVIIDNIRAKRPKPGLMAQHLTACRAVREASQGWWRYRVEYHAYRIARLL